MGIIDDIISFVMDDEERSTYILSCIFLVWGVSVWISLQVVTAPYGRYVRSGWGLAVPVKFAWIVQELPSFAVPLLVYALSPDCPKANNLVNRFALGLFLLHYFQRTFIFPLLIRGGKSTPMVPFVMAIFFCLLNGWLQSTHLLKFADLGDSPLSHIRIAAGTCVFLTGMAINIHSDHVLRNLRKPGETGYKIPTGGMFEYVSGANFLGEIIEWWGFALVCATLPTLAFAVFTLLNIGPRACHHHKWYKEKFDDYPKKRKAIIPFIL